MQFNVVKCEPRLTCRPTGEQTIALMWAVALTVFLAATGALDTDAANWLERLSYWMLAVGIGVVATLGGYFFARRYELPNLTLALLSVVCWLLPVTACALALCIAMFGGSWSIARFMTLVPTIASMLIVLQLPLLFRPGARNKANKLGDRRGQSARNDGWLPMPYRHATLYALEAQDHYVQVHTSCGSIMVRKRFADAVASVSASGEAGVRTHRSWWLSRDAVVRLEREQGRRTAVLVNGLRIPVSRSCAEPIGPPDLTARQDI